MEFLRVLFTVVLYLNILLAVASFFFAFILLRRSKGDAIYFNFGMAVLMLGVWMFVTLSDYFGLTPFSSSLHARLGFLLGLWALHYFLIFTYYFPLQKMVTKSVTPFFYIGTIAISVLALWPGLITSASVDFPFRYREINPLGLTIYTVYFSFLAIIAFTNLFKRYEASDGIHRRQLKKIIAGTAVAVVANLFFSLINFYYVSFDLTHLGMFFAFTILIYIYLILFSKKPA
ncbi:MAG TPA: hypothetical protein VJH75_01220 [Patescibacteria group bacterium]|nr:hypothetical protein [Patescibacteria group bacterium]